MWKHAFKKWLDRWLRDIPDTTKIDNYWVSVDAETNIIKQNKNNK